MLPLQEGLTRSGAYRAAQNNPLGQLAWDLPAQKTYVPKTDLPFTLQATNPTAGDRSYKVQVQAIVQGQVVWYADLLLQGMADVWFSVPAGQTFGIQGVFNADQTNFTFKALLIDQAANQVVAAVQSDLVGTAAPPSPTPKPATPGFDMTPLFSVLTLGLVMGLMSSMTGMFKGR